MILIVDDDIMIRTCLAKYLSEHDHEVLIAKDGKEAIEYIKSFESEIDLILLDLIMPEKDGNDVIQECLKNPKHAPIIVLSGYLNSLKEDFKTVPIGIISKPFNFKNLLKEINKAIQK